MNLELIKDKTNIKNVAVLGGGAAGYLTALYIQKNFPDWRITIVESSAIPVIGVGEATTPMVVNFLHNHLEFSTTEFFREVKPTFKLGVKLDWGKAGDYFYNVALGSNDIVNAMHHNNNILDASMASLLMQQNKGPLFRKDQKQKSSLKQIPLEIAYHLDNKLFVSYLKKKISVTNISFWDVVIDDVSFDNYGNIAAIQSKDAKRNFDFYFDCSGFRSFLLGDKLNSAFKSYANTLFTNKAIVGKKIIGPEDSIQHFTTASTLNHGWLWNTPTQTEEHLGYVFCDEFCTVEEAIAEMELHCEEVDQKKVISFRTGRYNNSWTKNVVAIGNSFAFIEPIESTGIHMIANQILHFGRYFKRYNVETAKEKYNGKTNRTWDNLRDFIGLHFKFNKKSSTPYWKKCNKETDLSGIKDYVDYFVNNGPISWNPEHPICQKINADPVFGASSYDVNMMGCGMYDISKGFEQVSAGWKKQYAVQNMIWHQAISHRESLRFFEDNPLRIIH